MSWFYTDSPFHTPCLLFLFFIFCHEVVIYFCCGLDCFCCGSFFGFGGSGGCMPFDEEKTIRYFHTGAYAHKEHDKCWFALS